MSVPLTFTLRGLDDRDARLFRSFVRLVDHRTQHRWEWTESSADLVVLHEGVHEPPSSRVTLRVGRQPQSTRPTGDYLGLPLRADAVEDCLNAMGLRALVVRQTASGQRMVAAPHPAAATDMLVQLLRRPPAAADKRAPHAPGHVDDGPADHLAGAVPALGPCARDLRGLPEPPRCHRPAALDRHGTPQQRCPGSCPGHSRPHPPAACPIDESLRA
ncbi:hypothetical protein ACHFCA_33550 [Delftia tsuruhatensis]